MRRVEAAFHAMHERVLDVCVAHQRQEAQRRSKRKATLLKRARELRTKLATASPRLEARYVRADCTGHVVPGARPCALGTFSYLVTSRSYFCLSYPNRFL